LLSPDVAASVLSPDGAHGALRYSHSIAFDLTDAYTFSIVAVIGVLMLGAYQADQSEHPRLAVGLIAAAIATLIGPLVVLGILIAVLWYAIFLGLPAAGCVLLIRRLRRRRA
jgi:hypothetical protein